MEDNLWDGYVLFLKNTYNLTPEQTYFNLNAILELKNIGLGDYDLSLLPM
jgi:hypothetical protein